MLSYLMASVGVGQWVSKAVYARHMCSQHLLIRCNVPNLTTGVWPRTLYCVTQGLVYFDILP